MANSNVNIKMGVSGVSQFKNNMNQAKQAVKTYDAQLALTEKQFKQTGDAEEYMAKKTAELEGKLAAQKSVVENAEKALQAMTEKGVDKSSKAYQDMYRSMLQAKGAIIDTENELNGVATAGEDATKGVQEMNKGLKEVGKGVAWENVTNGLHSINEGISKTIKKAWSLGTALVNNTLGAGAWADELKTTAAQMSTAEWEVTPEDLQKMRKTATLIDTDVESIVKSRQTLMKGIGKGTKATMSALEFLGINPEGMDKEDLFWKIGDEIMALTDDTEQEAQATALFGKSWKDLIPMFQAGREEYDKTMDSWSVVENDQIDKLGEMDDAYQKLSQEWETFKMELLSTFAEPMKTGMDKLTEFVKTLNDYLDTPEGQAMLKQLGDTITQLITDLVNVNPQDVVNGLAGVIDAVKNGLEWIQDNSEGVKTGLLVIAGGIAALKLAEFASHIGQIVSGFNVLWGGANRKLPTLPGTDTTTPAATSTAVPEHKLINTLSQSPVGLATAKIAPKLLHFSSVNGGSVVDWLANNSPWATLIQGTETAGQWWERVKSEQEERAATFASNWDPNDPNANVIAKLFKGHESAYTPETMEEADWRPSYMRGTQSNYYNPNMVSAEEVAASVERMTEATGDLTGASEEQKKSSGELLAAAGKLDGLPSTIEKAILDGLSQVRINIDGYTAGQVLTPYVNAGMGQKVMMVTK